MRKPVAVLVLWIAAAGVAMAQTPAPESVTVTGTKEREVLRGFVDSVAAPTHYVGKLARWEVPICPYTAGIKPEAAQFVTDRVKAVAAEIGAPVSTDAKCTFNIEIVFTKTPQALLDDMKKNQPALLGYQSSSEEMDRLATFSRPIEARYTTATKDLRGKVEIDSSGTLSKGQGLTMQFPCVMLGRKFEPPGKICTNTIPQARKLAVTGARLGDGLRSNFYHIVIVVDPRLIAGQQLDAVSDYIAMMALTQLGSLDSCQTLPSIVNLLANDCANPPNGLTVTDKGYLRGLYRMQADMNLGVQKNEIATQMERAMVSQ
jgi:hypothetical protein